MMMMMMTMMMKDLALDASTHFKPFTKQTELCTTGHFCHPVTNFNGDNDDDDVDDDDDDNDDDGDDDGNDDDDDFSLSAFNYG